MSLPALYLPEAEDDIAAAHSYYERQRVGLGDDFVEALREAVDLIRSGLQLYGAFLRDIRAAPLKQFPISHRLIRLPLQGIGWMKKQRSETRLFKVAVGGQGVGQLPPGHDRERDAIGERPRLIGAGGEQFRARIQPLGRGRDDLRSRVGVKPCEKRDEEGAIDPANQAVSDLKYDIFGREERLAQRTAPGYCLFVVLVGRPKKGQKIRSVGEDRRHDDFGAP
jgi:hypothetical protein